MREQARWFLLAAAGAALSACAAGPPAQSANRPPDAAQACADWRWIAVLDRPADVCPRARNGWKEERLFGDDKRLQQQREKGAAYAAAAPATHESKPAADAPSPQEAMAQLNRFCVYEVTDKSRKASFPPVTSPAVVRLDQDCAALAVAAAPPIETMDWQPIAADFLAQTGKPTSPLTIKNERGVRLAFVDTQPTGDFHASTPPGNSRHGFTLAHIARQLVCSSTESESCAARITTRLALPLASFDAHNPARTYDGRHGGYIGTQRDLAKAITDEVSEWFAELDQPKAPRHLVLNLSLAWDPELFAGLDEAQVAELRAGSQAVYRALQYAASRDVLVLAAAGNKKICPDAAQRGPMLPAAWEIGGPRDSCVESPPPIVYAVGGLERHDQPIWNGRDDAMPRRATYADNAVVPAGNPAVPTALYSGTSVATAVASSIAAIVWDTLPPGRDARSVMKLVDASGKALNNGADFWPGVGDASLVGTAAPKVHRLSLCDALRRACNEGGAADCPLPPEPCPPLPEAMEFARLVSARELPDTCQPWIFPQPEDPPCPTCTGDPPRH